MQFKAYKQLKKFDVLSETKKIGKVADFIVDKNNWMVSSVLVKRGMWPITTQFEIPVKHIIEINKEDHTICLDLSKEFLTSLEINPTRKLSDRLSNFFRWGTYRYRNYYHMPINKDSVQIREAQKVSPITEEEVVVEQEQVFEKSLGDIKNLVAKTEDNYEVEIKDFILEMDKANTRVQYLVVGEDEDKGFVPLNWIQQIRFTENSLQLNKSRQMVLQGPYATGGIG